MANFDFTELLFPGRFLLGILICQQNMQCFTWFLVSITCLAINFQQISQSSTINRSFIFDPLLYLSVTYLGMNHYANKNIVNMDCLNCCFILLFSVAGLSLIRFSPQCWHIALSMSESLPAQRDGKFTAGLTQILVIGIWAFKQ